MSETSDDRVRYELVGSVATLKLDSPGRLNAFDGPMSTVVLRHLESAAADREVRVLVLRGAGGTFSAGGDLKSILAAGRGSGSLSDTLDSRTLLGIAEVLRRMPAVSIAAVQGVCAGGALGWACACDLRVASTSARFVPAFAAAGQTGDYGITWTLPRIAGEGRARDLLFVGDHLDADQAERIGLVTRVHDDDVFDAGVAELSEQLAGRAPLALQGIKSNLEVGGGCTLAETLDTEAATMTKNLHTDDAREAMAAFAEKRPPRFTGR